MALPAFQEHLLPPNAKPAERVVAALTSRVQAIPTPIETIKHPYQVPTAFLPFLGWEMSVDVWFNSWPDSTKRNITARSLELHKKKGTLYTVSEYVRYAGGQVISAERPPLRFVLGPSLTREQRQAWLAQLPQVRVWLFNEQGRAGRAKSCFGGISKGQFAPGTFYVPSSALARMHRRARYVVSGKETDITVTDFGSYYQLHLRGRVGQAVFWNTIKPRRYYLPSSAWLRLVTIAPTPRLAYRSQVGPSLQAVTSEPERIAEHGARGHRMFIHRSTFEGHFYAPSTARYRLYDRYAVNDGTSPAPTRRAVNFWGVGRYRFPRHTAVLRVSIPGRLHRLAERWDGVALPRCRFWLPHDGTRVDDVRRAAQAAKRLSDRIKLDLGPKPHFVAGRPFYAAIDHLVVGKP